MLRLTPQLNRLLRHGAAALLCAAAVVLFATQVSDVYPIRDWLFWRLLVTWGWSGFFNLACLSLGHLVVTRVLRLNDLPLLELAVTSLTVGLVGFGTAMYIAGLLALFHPALAIILPLGMIAAGAPALWRAGLDLRDRWRNQPPEPPAPPVQRLLAGAAIAIGTLGIALVYLQCLSPEAISYDARWYHLPIAQDYAREGRLVPFNADFNKNFPHLASVIHTWDWLVPGRTFPLRGMLALHQEFALTLWAIAGVGAGAAWLAQRQRIRGAWAGFFLFPLLFVGDSNIAGGADHVYGVFAIPILLATMRALEDLSPRRCALIAILCAGATLTRYQSIYLLVPVATLIAGRWVWLSIRQRAPWSWRGPAMALGVGFVLVLPHFLTNAIFHHNPLYPFAVKLFPSSWPRQPDTPLLSRYLFSGDGRIPRGTFLVNLGDALALTFGKLPLTKPFLFGALFALAAPLMLFVHGARRLWLGALVVWLALITWGMTYPVERYLQGFIPIVAAVTVAILVRAWELGIAARAGVLALVAMQVVWSADIPFGDGFGRMTAGINLIRSGANGVAATRLDGWLAGEREMDRRLPRSAVLLLHNTRLSLGINRKVLQDLPGFQGLIDYRHTRTARELYDQLRGLGITHVVFEPSAWPAFSKQEEALFALMATRHADDLFSAGCCQVFALQAAPPPAEAPYRVLMLGQGGYEDGVYPIDGLGTFDPMPATKKHYAAPAIRVATDSPQLATIAGQVDVVIAANTVDPPATLAPVLNDRFVVAARYTDHAHFTVYTRRPPPAPPPPTAPATAQGPTAPPGAAAPH